jgi:hypothetical protein
MGLLAATPASAAPVAGIPPLVITEIVADNPGDDNFEYFEVHNTTADAIDLATAASPSPIRTSTPPTAAATCRLPSTVT